MANFTEQVCRSRRSFRQQTVSQIYDITAIFLAAAAQEEKLEEAALYGAQWNDSGFCQFSFADKSKFVWKKTIDIRVEVKWFERDSSFSTVITSAEGFCRLFMPFP